MVFPTGYESHQARSQSGQNSEKVHWRSDNLGGGSRDSLNILLISSNFRLPPNMGHKVPPHKKEPGRKFT